MIVESRVKRKEHEISTKVLREALRKHVEELKKVQDRREPKPGEIGRIDLEETEFLD